MTRRFPITPLVISLPAGVKEEMEEAAMKKGLTMAEEIRRRLQSQIGTQMWRRLTEQSPTGICGECGRIEFGHQDNKKD